MRPIGKRLRAGTAVSAAQQLLAILTQLSLVPLLLTIWGTPAYGAWLLLSAVPAYLTLSDVGFSAAAANLMAMRHARGDMNGARSAFYASLIIALVMLIMMSTALIVVQPMINYQKIFNITALTHGQCATIVVALGLATLVSMVRVNFYSVVAAEGRYPLAGALLAASRLVEFGFLVGAVLLKASPPQAALTQLSICLFTTALYAGYVWLRTPWLTGRGRWTNSSEIRQMVTPAVSFLLFPLSMAVNIQGVLLVLGHLVSPQALVAFASMRTISRMASLPVRATLEVSKIEISRAFGSADLVLLRRLVGGATLISSAIGLATFAVLTPLGGILLSLWTRGAVSIEWTVFIILMATALVQTISFASYLTLYSSNNHTSLAAIQLTINLCALAVLSFSKTSSVEFAAAELLAIELLLLWYMMTRASKVIALDMSNVKDVTHILGVARNRLLRFCSQFSPSNVDGK